MAGAGTPVGIAVHAVQYGQIQDEYQPVILETNRGAIECRYYDSRGSRYGVIWVGGVGGGWDTPAQGLYPRLCKELLAHEIGSLRVRFRDPTSLEEATRDVLAGAAFLQSVGVNNLALTGHSFGGAVVIRAAAATPTVRTVVTIAAQSYGASSVSQLGPRVAVLLIHGTADSVLPPATSHHLYKQANQPKTLRLFEGAGHGLDEVGGEVRQGVFDWLVERLKGTAG